MDRKTQSPVSEYLSKIGKIGTTGGKASGKARLTKMRPEQRSTIAKKAAVAALVEEVEPEV